MLQQTLESKHRSVHARALQHAATIAQVRIAASQNHETDMAKQQSVFS
jgi:hypothetical protein